MNTKTSTFRKWNMKITFLGFYPLTLKMFCVAQETAEDLHELSEQL